MQHASLQIYRSKVKNSKRYWTFPLTPCHLHYSYNLLFQPILLVQLKLQLVLQYDYEQKGDFKDWVPVHPNPNTEH